MKPTKNTAFGLALFADGFVSHRLERMRVSEAFDRLDRFSEASDFLFVAIFLRAS
jgi:hypothetical protein